MAKKQFIFVNQYTGYLFLDIVNSFAADYDCELYTGFIDPVKAQLSAQVKVRLLKKYNRNKPLNRIYTWLLFTIQLFARLLFKNRSTPLFIVTNPPLAPIAGLLLHKLKGTPYHLLMYDIYPDALVNMGIVKKGSFIDKMWGRLNHHVLKNAATIYTISDNMARLLHSYNTDAVITVIHNWADTAFINPVNKIENSFAAEYGQADKLTVMYSGNMGATHAVEKIAELAAAFANQPAFGFLLIGDGVKKALISNLKETQHLDNLTILPYQPHNILPFSLACADIGIVTLSAGAEDLSVPSKTYNLLAAGVALLVISSPESEIARMVTLYNCGRQFQEHETDEMIAYIQQMAAEPDLLQTMKANARAASHNFTPANADKYKTGLNANTPATHDVP